LQWHKATLSLVHHRGVEERIVQLFQSIFFPFSTKKPIFATLLTHNGHPAPMIPQKQNLSSHEPTVLADIENRIFALVVAQWNTAITHALETGARNTLMAQGARPENIHTYSVPGSFELPLVARWVADAGKADAIICIGCVIQGETPHFDFISQSTAQGVMQVGIESRIPVVFGVLTPLNMEQALDRAGGKHGNKGDEAAHTAIKMLYTREQIGV
jgi:6,7-dimethyl-8-ribityllumazine synthase